MQVFALWQGGPNYRPSVAPEDTEIFPSLSAAVDEYDHRASGSDPYYPVVQDSELWLFFSEPDGNDDYPDRIVRQGPRGGTVVELA